jgi:hypothetical protein
MIVSTSHSVLVNLPFFLFLNIFGRMLLTIGLENTKKMFKLLGMPYDIKE